MLPDGTYDGMVDRFEEDAAGTELAVVLLERDGEVVGQLDLPRAELPADVGQDAVLQLELVDGAAADITYDPEATETRAEAAQDRFDRLAERAPSDSESDADRDDE